MNLRDVIARLNFIGAKNREQTQLREFALGTVALQRQGKLRSRLDGMMEIKELMDAELATWLEPLEIAEGRSGSFDVCDLRVWLQLAEEAGIDAIPARHLMSLNEAQLSALLPKLSVPEPVTARMRAAVRDATSDLDLSGIPEPEDPDGQELMALHEQLSDAIGEIPASWMVRTHVSGSSNLKALVGTGLMLKADDTAMIAEGVELGAGWVRIGNRRMIDFADSRFIETVAKGHKDITHYLARPWAQPARFHEGEDLHRANSPLAGPGKWPAEWRVFIRNGEVTGVANYYGWTGEGASPQNAWNAVEAAARGQAIADLAVSKGLTGRFMDAALNRQTRAGNPDWETAIAKWDADGFHATLDFLESEEGMLLLEGGPAHMPGGGGHPCAFAGQGVSSEDPARLVASCEGVAFKAMPHVNLGEPRTWVDGDISGCIGSWDEAATLATDFSPLSDLGKRFLARRLEMAAPEPF